MICNPLNQRLLWIIFIIVYISKIENANHLHLGFLLYITIIVICREELVSCKNLFTILYLIYFNRICSNKRNINSPVNELFTFIRSVAAIVWLICKIRNKCGMCDNIMHTFLTHFEGGLLKKKENTPKLQSGSLHRYNYF